MERTGDVLIIKERYTRHRSFSQLGDMQRAHRLEYALIFDARGKATYEVTDLCGTAVRTERRAVRALCRQKARWILELLYENAVLIEHVQDVLEDLLRQV